MPNAADLQFYILHGKEERYLEYKRSMIWTGNDTTKVKIAKAMMAMANLRNGGVIVIGMQETNRGMWVPEVMTRQQISSFTQDDVAQWVNDYATPAVQFILGAFVLNGNEFVIIQVQEFDTSPPFFGVTPNIFLAMLPHLHTISLCFTGIGCLPLF
ncbi:ATP-binding protein [Chloroflexota bacterium]